MNFNMIKYQIKITPLIVLLDLIQLKSTKSKVKQFQIMKILINQNKEEERLDLKNKTSKNIKTLVSRKSRISNKI
jgi:hypothetical protein